MVSENFVKSRMNFVKKRLRSTYEPLSFARYVGLIEELMPDVKSCVFESYERFKETGEYVPLIRALSFLNDPIFNYSRIDPEIETFINQRISVDLADVMFNHVRDLVAMGKTADDAISVLIKYSDMNFSEIYKEIGSRVALWYESRAEKP